jgi:FixJ family two-component response regulator
MQIPNRKNPCWRDAAWRTRFLREIMDTRGLTATMVAEILDTAEQTVFNWRASTARPISAHSLKALVFEVERESLV